MEYHSVARKSKLLLSAELVCSSQTSSELQCADRAGLCSPGERALNCGPTEGVALGRFNLEEEILLNSFMKVTK